MKASRISAWTLSIALLSLAAVACSEPGGSGTPAAEPTAAGAPGTPPVAVGATLAPESGTPDPASTVVPVDAAAHRCVDRPDGIAAPPAIPPGEDLVIDPRSGEHLPAADAADFPALCPDGQMAVSSAIDAPKANPFPVRFDDDRGPNPPPVGGSPMPLATGAALPPAGVGPYFAGFAPAPPRPARGPVTIGRAAAQTIGPPGQFCSYAYAWSGLPKTSRGAAVSAQVFTPTVSVGHSLFEIAAHNGVAGDYVEAGWRVAPDQGDNLPHLFVHWWAGGEPKCYNGGEADPASCPAKGWQPYAGNAYAGMPLEPGETYFFGLYLVENALQGKHNWWVRLNNTWVGYYDGALWPTPASKGASMSWFGEVCTGPSLNEMGNGAKPPDAENEPAWFQWPCVVGTSNYGCTVVEEPWTMATWADYDIEPGPLDLSGRRHYGGP